MQRCKKNGRAIPLLIFIAGDAQVRFVTSASAANVRSPRRARAPAALAVAQFVIHFGKSSEKSPVHRRREVDFIRTPL